jgi:ribonuclease P protein subunit POP4
MGYHPEEFIGQNLTVKTAKNKSLQGLTGKIIDETKKTFTIKTSDGDKRVLKEGCTFTIGNQTVEGEELALRPEERIKRKK